MDSDFNPDAPGLKRKNLFMMSFLNFTVLVVDDDQDDIELFCDALKLINSSITCLRAEDGLVALNLLNQLIILPQIIFMDFNMPRMNGGLCLAEIRKTEHLKDIPVVMYSTFFSEEGIKEFKKAGAYLIKKQVEFNGMIQNIVSALRNFYPDLQSNLQ